MTKATLGATPAGSQLGGQSRQGGVTILLRTPPFKAKLTPTFSIRTPSSFSDSHFS